MRVAENREELLLKYAPGGRWAELGVARGDFSATWLSRQDVKEVWLFDCWGPYPGADPRDPAVLDEESGQRLYEEVEKRFAEDPRVFLVRGLIEETLPTFPRGFFDLIYIDAAHDEESVRAHLELAFTRLRRGGWLAGHDYDHPGEAWLPGVKAAVDHFCCSRNLRIGWKTREPYSSFVIVVPWDPRHKGGVM